MLARSRRSRSGTPLNQCKNSRATSKWITSRHAECWSTFIHSSAKILRFKLYSGLLGNLLRTVQLGSNEVSLHVSMRPEYSALNSSQPLPNQWFGAADVVFGVEELIVSNFLASTHRPTVHKDESKAGCKQGNFTCQISLGTAQLDVGDSLHSKTSSAKVNCLG